MKLMRFESDARQVLFGLYDPEKPHRSWVVEGDLFGKMKVTKKKAAVKRILPPVSPPNILALGLNYRAHSDECNISYPDMPILFLKGTNSVIGPGDPIVLPAAGPDEVDYEAELAVVIGKAAKNVSPDEAMDCVLGYTCANDISARDWQIQKQKGQWARGKSFDTFCPIGPCLVTKEDIENPNALRIQAVLNGKTLQDSSTGYMIFNVENVVSQLSRSMTLLPGTIILTGTPEGVGFTRQPPIFLREGDVVSVEIEGIGVLTNAVLREK